MAEEQQEEIDFSKYQQQPMTQAPMTAGSEGQWRVMNTEEQAAFWDNHCSGTKGGKCQFDNGTCKRCGKDQQ
jgi:hypothetical protein